VISIRNLKPILSDHGEACPEFVEGYRAIPQRKRDVVVELQVNIPKKQGLQFFSLDSPNPGA
jgi:hypothetical protein